MSTLKHTTLARMFVLFVALSLPLAACGQAPQPTTGETDLRATVSVLQTQIANQPQPTAGQAATVQALEPASATVQAPEPASATVQAPEPTSSAVTSATHVNDEQEYLALPEESRNAFRQARDNDKVAYFLHWTEQNGQITGELLEAGTIDGKPLNRSMEVTGTHNGSTLNLAIEVFLGNKNTFKGTITKKGLEVEGLEGKAIFHPATKQEFETEIQTIVAQVPTAPSTIVGKWRYTFTNLDGKFYSADPRQVGVITALEFFNDNSMVLTLPDGTQQMLSYKVSDDNKMVSFIGPNGQEASSLYIEGDKLVDRINVITKLNDPGQKQESFYERVQ